MRRLTVSGLRILLVGALLLPVGCVQTIAGMVVKHVAVSAAKNVAKSHYEEYKRNKDEEQAARAAEAARKHRSQHDDGRYDETSDDSNNEAAP